MNTTFTIASCAAIALAAATCNAAESTKRVDRDFLVKLMSIQSTSDNIPKVNEAVEFVRARLESGGVPCAVEKDADGRCALYASTLPGKAMDYLLVVHLDVVPAGPEQFVPRIEGDHIVGRGSYDCKGNAAIAAQVLLDLKGRASVGAVFSGDEETGGLTTKMMAERGYVAKKLVIVFDSGSYGAYYAQKGNYYVRARMRGRGGHSSRPWECDNPIDRLVEGCARVRAAWPKPTADRWCNVLSATVVSGGEARNQIPDYVDIWYNLRYIDEDAPDRLCNLLEKEGGFEVVEKRSSGGPMESDKNNPEIRRFFEARRAKWPAKDPQLGRMLAMTDARHYAGRGAPVLISGSCGAKAHAVDEWNDLANMDENVEMLEDYFSAAWLSPIR